MHARFIFVLATFFGIALAPVQPVLGACAPVAPAACHSCCSDAAMECCTASANPQPGSPLAPIPTGDHAKQLLAPAIIFLGLSPLPPAERPVVRTFPARLDAPAPLARTCILLI